MVGENNVKRIWRQIFQELSDDGGNTVKWKAMAQALGKMRMHISVKELEMMGLAKQVMDFDTFFSTIHSGVRKRLDIHCGARMVKSKREIVSYEKNYETEMQVCRGSRDSAISRILEETDQRFGNGKWVMLPQFSDHPDWAVEGALVQVYRYLPDGIIFFSSFGHLILSFSFRLSHDQSYHLQSYP